MHIICAQNALNVHCAQGMDTTDYVTSPVYIYERTLLMEVLSLRRSCTEYWSGRVEEFTAIDNGTQSLSCIQVSQVNKRDKYYSVEKKQCINMAISTGVGSCFVEKQS